MSDDTNSSAADVVPLIHLRVTAPWTSSTDFEAALARHSPEYQNGPDGLVHVPSGNTFECSATEHDDQIAEIFAQGSRLSRKEVDAIAAHRVKIHLTGPGGSPKAARAIMAAATAVLRAGGTGVFVDNSGVAHGKKDWLKLASDKKPGGLCWAYVAVTGAEDEIFSTGMHCLGFRDAELPDPPDREFGGFLMHNFLGYVYQSGITIKDGDPLGDEKSTMYRAHHRPCTRYHQGTPFHNPYGIWRLIAVPRVGHN